MTSRLSDAVRRLLTDVLARYRDCPWVVDLLRDQLARLAEPPRIAVAGGRSSGKSTLVNAILGEEIGPVELTDGRPVFVWYEDAPVPRITTDAPRGARRELAASRAARGLRVDAPGSADEVVDVVVGGRRRLLRHMTVVDTPAVPAAGEESRAAVAERILRVADVVLYLTPDVRGSDLGFLRHAHEGMVAAAAPTNLLLVLSRADEAGGGRPDALLSARQAARHQGRHPRIAPLCLGVVAVSGLVALAGRVLGEAEFGALAALAAMPRADLEPYLLSADRFVSTSASLPVDEVARRRLLARLGLVGVRLAMTLIRVAGCDSRAKLAAELVRRSGFVELREAIGRYVVDRAETVRARSALLAVERVLRAEPRPGSGELFARLEQIVVGAHEFREIRLLAALHSARVRFDAELAREARRLLGGDGTEIIARLGVEREARRDELWARAMAALTRWRGLSDDPVLDTAQRRAARVVVRSCEGILAELAGHYYL